ncbi:MAG: ABC transporter substrate-binding protein [Luteibaculum sp.]
MRIVSLVPSLTEFLYDLGLEKEVCGITKFCVHPEQWFRSKMRIGGTKNPKLPEILALQPDLVVANKEENRKVDIEGLQAAGIEVLITEINSLEDQERELKRLAKVCNKAELGAEIAEDISKSIQQLSKLDTEKSLLYCIWNNPKMFAGGDTFISSLTRHLGFKNLAENHIYSRYPEISEEDIKDLNPDVLMLSSEPYPFKTKHLLDFQNLLPDTEILLVDGELFSWYGTRLKFLPAHWKSICHSLNLSLA